MKKSKQQLSKILHQSELYRFFGVVVPEFVEMRAKVSLDNIDAGKMYELRVSNDTVDILEADGIWYVVCTKERLHEFFQGEHEAFDNKMDDLLK